MTQQQKESAIEHFEDNLKKLESLVDTLESQDLSLEAALKSFEQGIQIAQFCEKQLKSARQKVDILLATDQGINSEPFDIETDN